MKGTYYTKKVIRIKHEIDINPLCPECDSIVCYSYENEIPPFCPRCNRDLSLPINPIRKFFHNLFWGASGKEDKIKYQLARYIPKNKQEIFKEKTLDRLKKIEKLCKFNKHAREDKNSEI